MRIRKNADSRFRIDTTGNTAAAGVRVTIDNSNMSGNVNDIVVNVPAGTTNADLMLANSDVLSNSGNGILASGANARVFVGNTTITGNGTGVLPGGGALINSYGDNRLNRNVAADGAFTPGVIGKL